MARVGLAILVVAGAAACGGGHGRTAPVSGRGPDTTVYFLTDRGAAVIGVRRRLSGSDYPRSALRLLLAGPTARERELGLSSAIPADATIRSVSVSTSAPYGSTVVDLRGLPSLEPAGPVRVTQIATQVARSLIGLSGITRVSIRSNGRPWGLLGIRGGVLEKPWDYALLVSFGRICVGKWHARFSTGPCFSPLP